MKTMIYWNKNIWDKTIDLTLLINKLVYLVYTFGHSLKFQTGVRMKYKSRLKFSKKKSIKSLYILDQFYLLT